ncbi:MAG: hypothetical protein AB7L09_17545 [Nitrospira sp.]
MDATLSLPFASQAKRLNVFERYLSLWVLLCMLTGVVLSLACPAAVGLLREMELGAGSHINLPIAVLFDPAAASPERRLDEFRRVRDEIAEHLRTFLTDEFKPAPAGSR